MDDSGLAYSAREVGGMKARWLTPAEVCVWLGVSIGAVRVTAHRDNWRRQYVGRVVWYSADDVDATRERRLAERESEYNAAHSRVLRARGKASEYPCVDCGRRAYQWSYDHMDKDERRSTRPASNGYLYSTDPLHYDPRCTSCHSKFDRSHASAWHTQAEGVA